MEIPVYLFTGFLDSGKTKFIQETLTDERFNDGKGNILVILCEEGEEELDASKFVHPNVAIEIIDDEEHLNKFELAAMQKKHKAKKIVVEYNGMWTLDKFFEAMPSSWLIYQEMSFADSNTYLTYNANMRNLVVDKLNNCDAIIFNRVPYEMDKMELHKIVRGISRGAAIIYDHVDGKVQMDEIEDPLPFDIEASIIEIADTDYAIWYRDITEEMDKYNGTTVKFKVMTAKGDHLPKNSFIVGRHIMTCCADDIAFGGLLCEWESSSCIKNKEWINLTAKIEIKNCSVYGRVGPVLKAINVELANPPTEDVVTFY